MIEDTWICFSQSDSQQELINELDMAKYRISLEGPFDVWVDEHLLKYFILYARDVMPKKEVNLIEEQLNKEHELHSKFHFYLYSSSIYNSNNLISLIVDVSDIPLSNFGNREIENVINPFKQMHIQDDGTILSIVATGTSSRQSLVVWLKMFEKENPRLKSMPVLMTNLESN